MEIEKEIWRPVVGYEGLYEVSNKSNVRSVDRLVRNVRGNGFHVRKGVVLTPCGTYNGYDLRLQVALSKNGKSKNFLIYRLSAFAFPEICGEYFEGAVVDHKDGNPLNNNVENLEFVPQSENIRRGSMREKQHEAVSAPVLKKNLEGYIVDRYDSIAEAARIEKISSPSMQKRIKHHTIVKGYVWCKS